jgi:hypothetical protein
MDPLIVNAAAGVRVRDLVAISASRGSGNAETSWSFPEDGGPPELDQFRGSFRLYRLGEEARIEKSNG